MDRPKILLLDLDPTLGTGKTLQGVLESSTSAKLEVRRESFDPLELFARGERLARAVACFGPELIFLILPADFLSRAGELLPSVRRGSPEAPVVAVVAAREPDETFALIKLGVADFITPPLKAVDILPRAWRLLDHSREEENLARALKEKFGLKQFVSESTAFLAEVRKIPLIARCDASVLISGETGTGKELCARAIHYLSPRAHKPFVPVNCGAIPLELIENELFGHARGAFTGASAAEKGLINEGDGGTLFLDEIDCLPPMTQVKLLRFLQEKEYRPLGSTKMRKADVRVLAATNADLARALRAGRLRQDLYYRLNVIPVVLPPLRERREDILPLARHFLAKYVSEFNNGVEEFSSEAVRALVCYDWPGNVRELEHVIERAVVLAEGSVINCAGLTLPEQEPAGRRESFREVKTKVIEQFEKSYIQELLLAYEGNITKAAQVAQKNRRAFWQLIRKHRIDARSFKEGGWGGGGLNH